MMEFEELKNIWSDYDKKLERSLSLNKELLKKINLDKTESRLNKVVWFRVLEGIAFLLIIILLGRFIATNFAVSAPVISAAILDIFAIIGLTGSIKQIVLLKQIDYAGTITSIQTQLEKVNAHSLQIFKLLILSAPFNLAYVFLGFKLLFDVDLFSHMDSQAVTNNIIAALIAAVPTIWFYRKLNFYHPQSNWVKKIIDSIVGNRVTSAIIFLDEIEEFEKETEN
jgi:hypothetical protein